MGNWSRSWWSTRRISICLGEIIKPATLWWTMDPAPGDLWRLWQPLTWNHLSDKKYCRVHAALVWHKHLERSFLVDLGSSKASNTWTLILYFERLSVYLAAHGTYIGNFRLEKNKPTQLPVDSVFRFGESTRRYCQTIKCRSNYLKARYYENFTRYVMRERPQNRHKPVMDELEKTGLSRL